MAARSPSVLFPSHWGRAASLCPRSSPLLPSSEICSLLFTPAHGCLWGESQDAYRGVPWQSLLSPLDSSPRLWQSTQCCPHEPPPCSTAAPWGWTKGSS